MKSELVYIMSEVDDKYIIEASSCIEQNEKRSLYRFRYAFGVVAAIVCVIILSISNPVLARKLPFVGNIFEYLQDKLDFSGAYQNYSSNADMTVKSGGITVNIQETYCDGENLFVSYQIESDKAFSEYTSEEILKTQLDFDGVICAVSDGKGLNVGDFGVSGLEGEFVDEHTFIGVETVRLEDGVFPDTFVYEVQLYSWNLILNNGTEHKISGFWNLSIPITVNREEVEVIKVNASEENHNIDQVVVSPIMITIYTSYPELYNDNVNYEVVVFSEKTDNNITYQACYGNTEGKTWIPRNLVGDSLSIYVVDYSSFTLKGKDAYDKKEIEKHAIVSTHIDLTE